MINDIQKEKIIQYSKTNNKTLFEAICEVLYIDPSFELQGIKATQILEYIHNSKKD